MPRLTAEQRLVRLSGVGASESNQIVAMNPWRGPTDLWVRKPVGARAPLVVDGDNVDEDGEEEQNQAQVGHVLEPALRELFTLRTGIKLAGVSATYRHPDFACVLASPDDLALDEDAGVEIKLVSSRMAHHWADDSIPDYVTTQTAQCMAVLNRARWHVLALIGSVPKLYVIDRDLELEESLVVSVVDFWEINVVGDEPPMPVTWEERKRYLRARYPGSEKTACRPEPDADGELAALVSRKLEAERGIEELEAVREEAIGALCERTGDAYGIEGSWGKHLWYGCRGRVNWEGVAEELAGGSIPVQVIEKHRGDGFRVSRYYPPKKTAGSRRMR